LKPLSQLPVTSDLPRLVNTIILTDERDESKGSSFLHSRLTFLETFCGSSETFVGLSAREKILVFLIALAKLIETEENNEKLETVYRQMVTVDSNETGLLSTQLGKFLVEGLKEETALVRVLKVAYF
jgi:hypothetical protein